MTQLPAKPLNPYEYGRPVTDHEVFAGRYALLREVDYTLGLATSERPQYRNLAITGPRGVGKTSLLNEIAYLAGINGLLAARVELNNELAASQVALFHHMLEDIACRFREHQRLGGFRQRLARFTRRTSLDVELNLVIGQLKAAQRDEVDVPQEALRKSLRDAVAEARRLKRHGIVVCIDEADLLARDETVLQALRNTFQQQDGYVLVLAGREDLLANLGRVFGPMQRFFNQMKLGPFDGEKEVRHCLEAPLPEAERSVLTNGFVSEVYGLTGGHPHLVKLMAFHAYRAMQEDGRSRLRLSQQILDATLEGARTSELAEDIAARLTKRSQEPFDLVDVESPKHPVTTLRDVEDEVAPLIDIQTITDTTNEASVIKFVNQMLVDAVTRGATDVHLLPQLSDMTVRLRIDGVMTESTSVPQAARNGVISRLKIMSNLDIAERRLPQSGRMRVKMSSGEVTCLIQTSPTLHGEAVILHIRRNEAAALALPDTGLTERDLAGIDQALHGNGGLILVAGSIGSGRTTTLYGLVRRVGLDRLFAASVEDSVDVPIHNLVQHQTRPQVGLTTAALVRNIVAQNPDLLMVDARLDRESAHATLNAAESGRLVIASIAAEDAATGLRALLDFDVHRALVARTLRLVIGQRLLRRLCDNCASRDQGSAQRTGCERCRFTGYKGRVGLFELLPVSEPLREAIRRDVSALELGALGVREGMKPLRDLAEEATRSGVTRREEVARVFG